jgi:hypothetical protein
MAAVGLFEREIAVTDGALPAARRRLSFAVARLIDPQPHAHGGGVVEIDSLYDQLREALPGCKRERSGVSRSMPPLWIDAVTLLAEIDSEVRGFTPRLPWLLSTPLRLTDLDARKWRPQDAGRVETVAGRCEYWAKAIVALLDPQPVYHMSAPCPACNTSWVYRRDGDEMVRKPALQLTATGCTCLKCRHTWAPEYYRLLAGALGCPLPAGVLE